MRKFLAACLWGVAALFPLETWGFGPTCTEGEDIMIGCDLGVMAYPQSSVCAMPMNPLMNCSAAEIANLNAKLKSVTAAQAMTVMNDIGQSCAPQSNMTCNGKPCLLCQLGWMQYEHIDLLSELNKVQGGTNPGSQPPAGPNCNGAWDYDINPRSTDQYACKEDGKVLAPFKSCNDDNLCENHDAIVAECKARCMAGDFGNPPPPAPPGSVVKEETLGLAFTFASENDCETKIGRVTSAKVEVPNNFSVAQYCARLFPQDVQVAPLEAKLPAKFEFTGVSDCESKTTSDLSVAGGTAIFPSGGSAEEYCSELFPPAPPAPPPNPPPPPRGPLPSRPNNGQCPPGYHEGEAGPASDPVCVEDGTGGIA